MFKFLTGATLGFAGGWFVFARTLTGVYVRDGSLEKAEAAIQRGLARNPQYKTEVRLDPELQPLTANQIRQRFQRGGY